MSDLLMYIRGTVSENQKMILLWDDSPEVLDFIGCPGAARASQLGPMTPDHLMHIKPKPLFIHPPAPIIATARLRGTGNPSAHDLKLVACIKQGLLTYKKDYLRYFNRYN